MLETAVKFSDQQKAVLRFLRQIIGGRLAIHEMTVPSVSQNSLGTRLPELAAMGYVLGDYRKGERYKEWEINRQAVDVLLMSQPEVLR